MRKLSVIFMIILIFIGSTPILNVERARAGQNVLQVRTDRSAYSIGDTVIIEIQLLSDPLDPIPQGATLSVVLEIARPNDFPLEHTITLTTDAAGNARDIFSLYLDPSFEPGTYSVMAYYSFNGFQSNVVTFTVIAGAAFDFTILLSPTSVTVEPGETGNFKVLITYSDPSHAGTMINIQVTGLGPGMNFQLSTLGDLKITTSSNTPPGTYPITVIGTAQGKTHQTSGTIIVTTKAPTTTQTPTTTITTQTQTTQPTGDFTILPSPRDTSILQGGYATFTLTVDKSGEFNDPVSFTGVSGHPSDSAFDLSPEEGSPPFSALLRINTLASTKPGIYIITVQASGGGKTHSTTVTLTIKEKPTETETPVSTTTEAETTTASGTSISTLLSNPMYLMIIVIIVLATALGATALRRRAPAPALAPARPEPSAGYCLNCGARIKPGATFCRSCGQQIE